MRNWIGRFMAAMLVVASVQTFAQNEVDSGKP